VRWRREHYERCVARRCIVIGRDAQRGIGRLFPQSRLKKTRSFYTAAANLPVQGLCSDIAMKAIAYADARLFEAGVDGGIVCWLHDELVLETAVEDVVQAVGLLKEAMTDAFVELLPDAPLNGLVEPHIGRDWSEAK
jgi:DNA polymerase I-like protein with 3'-5' exonuclease and polymerase domains